MRRRALVLGSAATLGGCGFHPLYRPESGPGGAGVAELSAIFVPVIPERPGQLLRQALQRRLEGSGTGIAKKYELVASAGLASEAVAIQRDTSTTRIRLVGNSTWSLRQLDLAHTVLLSGTSRVVDGYNVLNQQYFAVDLENEAVVRRIEESLADKIVTGVAIFLRHRALTPPTA